MQRSRQVNAIVQVLNDLFLLSSVSRVVADSQQAETLFRANTGLLVIIECILISSSFSHSDHEIDWCFHTIAWVNNFVLLFRSRE
jgi:hypothetical protein